MIPLRVIALRRQEVYLLIQNIFIGHLLATRHSVGFGNRVVNKIDKLACPHGNKVLVGKTSTK